MELGGSRGIRGVGALGNWGGKLAIGELGSCCLGLGEGGGEL